MLKRATQAGRQNPLELKALYMGSRRKVQSSSKKQSVFALAEASGRGSRSQPLPRRTSGKAGRPVLLPLGDGKRGAVRHLENCVCDKPHRTGVSGISGREVEEGVHRSYWGSENWGFG